MKTYLLETTVEADLITVWKGFDEKLFVALKPPLMPLKLVEFGGCKKGDWVKLEVGPFRQAWHSYISENSEGENFFEFIDEGRKIPFPLKTWKHTHRIEKRDTGVVIIDRVEFTCMPRFLEPLMMQMVSWQFSIRPNVYKSFFKRDK